jgi:hypothetical protein
VYIGCWRLERTAEQIAEHLVRIEREAMGYDQATIGDLLPIARKLQAVDLRLDTEGNGKR